MIVRLLALRKHSGFIRYFQNTSWMMAEQLLRIVAGLFVGVWVARYLGPEKFGLFSFVLAFAAIFGGISKLGLDNIVIRELVSYPEKRDVYLGTAFWLKIIGSLIVVCAIAPIMILMGYDSATNLYLSIVLVGMIFQSFDVIQFDFQSRVLAKIISICKTIQIIVSSMSKIYLVLVEAELVWFFMVTAIDSITLAISFLAAYRMQKSPSFFKNFDINIAKKISKDGLPLMVAGLGFTLFSNLDVIMIKSMIDESAAGIYSAAYRLTVLWHFLPGLVLTSFMPAMINAKNDLIVFEKRSEIITGVLIWFAIILAVVTTFFAGFIVDLMYGSKYNESSDLLVILIWVNIIIFFNSCWNYVNILRNKVKWVMYFHVLTAVFAFTFNLILIPTMGLIGSVYSILSSLVLSLIIFSFIDRGTVSLIVKSLIFWNRLR